MLWGNNDASIPAWLDVEIASFASLIENWAPSDGARPWIQKYMTRDFPKAEALGIIFKLHSWLVETRGKFITSERISGASISGTTLADVAAMPPADHIKAFTGAGTEAWVPIPGNEKRPSLISTANTMVYQTPPDVTHAFANATGEHVPSVVAVNMDVNELEVSDGRAPLAIRATIAATLLARHTKIGDPAKSPKRLMDRTAAIRCALGVADEIYRLAGETDADQS